MSLHAETIAKAVESGCTSSLTASWRRCLTHHRLHPDRIAPPSRLRDAELRDALAQVEPVLTVAREHLDQLFHVIGGSDHGLFFADAAGVIVDKRSSYRHETWARRPGEFIGVQMSERLQGTNGVGTALIEKRPVMILGEDHFLTPHGEMACFGAPVFGPRGDLAGCLSVTRPVAASTAGLDRAVLAVVTEASRRIELALLKQAFPTARLVVASPERCVGAVLAVDAHDVILGATHAARNLLDLAPGKLGQPILLRDALGAGAGVGSDQRLDSAERTAVARALARHGGNISSAARSLGITRGTLYRKIEVFGIDHHGRHKAAAAREA